MIITHDQLIPGIDDREMKVMEFKFHNPSEKRLQFNGDSLLRNDSLYSDVKIRFEGPIRFENRPIARNGGGGLDKLSLSDDAPADLLIDLNDSRFRQPAKNAQAFNYTSTDNDGLSTRVSFHLHEVDELQFKKIAGDATVKKMEELKDLILHPNFSTGKTTVSFQLPVKGSAMVKVLDSSLKVLYADKTSNGVFNKQVLMPKNGIYYLTIYQNKSWFVRQIVKE